MNTQKQTDLRLLGTAVADILKLSDCSLALINTDSMSAALLEVSNKGECTFKDGYDTATKEDFFEKAVQSISSDINFAQRLYQLCKDNKKSFIRYIKAGRQSNEMLGDDISCKSLDDIYVKGYNDSIEEIINAVKSITPDDAKIVVTGRLSAFYPTEHTIKSALTPMPFLPLERLIVCDELSVNTEELIAKGKAICEKLEKDKKSIGHNIMLQLKRLSGTELVDWLFILAKKGENFETLKNPKYSDSVIVHAQDPIVIFADSEQYNFKFPRALFAMGDVTAKVQIALGIENDVPKLILKSADKLSMLDIDSKIYEEG